MARRLSLIWKVGCWLILALLGCALALSQETGAVYSHPRVWSAFTEYSNDSSHMLMGYASGRRLAGLGVSFERRTFLNSHVYGATLAEIEPVMAMSDPTMKGMTYSFPGQPGFSETVHFYSQVPVQDPLPSTPFKVVLVMQNVAYPGTGSYITGQRWTYVSGFSPIGYRLSMMPHRRLQPFVMGLGGVAVSSRDLPVLNSSAFNLTFQTGVGVEWFATHARSYRLEYRYHHLANVAGAANPGIDSGVFKFTCSFGR